MKILAVSDVVLDDIYQSNVRLRYPDVELLIGCGDLPYYYLDFLTSAFNVPMMYVLGNHDGGKQYVSDGSVKDKVRGGINLHGQVLRHKGLTFAGLEGSMRYKTGAPLMYTESEMTVQIARMLPKLLWHKAKYGRAVDVLVTHSPPFGVHDKSDIAHTGFKIMNTFIEQFKPRYLLHGHIHRSWSGKPQLTQVGKTAVINIAPKCAFTYGDFLESENE